MRVSAARSSATTIHKKSLRSLRISFADTKAKQFYRALDAISLSLFA
jgi:hypothetical protein